MFDKVNVTVVIGNNNDDIVKPPRDAHTLGALQDNELLRFYNTVSGIDYEVSHTNLPEHVALHLIREALMYLDGVKHE